MSAKAGFDGYGRCSCCRKRRAPKQLSSGQWKCKRCIEGCECMSKEAEREKATASSVEAAPLPHRSESDQFFVSCPVCGQRLLFGGSWSAS